MECWDPDLLVSNGKWSRRRGGLQVMFDCIMILMTSSQRCEFWFCSCVCDRDYSLRTEISFQAFLFKFFVTFFTSSLMTLLTITHLTLENSLSNSEQSWQQSRKLRHAEEKQYSQRWLDVCKGNYSRIIKIPKSYLCPDNRLMVSLFGDDVVFLPKN